MEILYIIAGVALLLWILSARHKSKMRDAREAGIYPPSGRGSDEDVRRLIGLGEKIMAVKLFREIHGVDLKETKDAVEQMAKRTS